MSHVGCRSRDGRSIWELVGIATGPRLSNGWSNGQRPQVSEVDVFAMNWMQDGKD